MLPVPTRRTAGFVTPPTDTQGRLGTCPAAPRKSRRRTAIQDHQQAGIPSHAAGDSLADPGGSRASAPARSTGQGTCGAGTERPWIVHRLSMRAARFGHSESSNSQESRSRIAETPSRRGAWSSACISSLQNINAHPASSTREVAPEDATAEPEIRICALSRGAGPGAPRPTYRVHRRRDGARWREEE